jgi:hypothetical protein
MASRLHPRDTSSRCRTDLWPQRITLRCSTFHPLLPREPLQLVINFYPDEAHHIRSPPATVGARSRFLVSFMGHDGERRGSSATGSRTFCWPHPTTWGLCQFYLIPLLRRLWCLTDNDRITIRCKITMLTPHQLEDTSSASPELPPAGPPQTHASRWDWRRRHIPRGGMGVPRAHGRPRRV